MACRSAARTLHTDNPDTDTARAFYAADTFPSTTDNPDSGSRNMNKAPKSNRAHHRRARNFYRLAYRIGERLFALAESGHFTKQLTDRHSGGDTAVSATPPVVLLCRPLFYMPVTTPRIARVPHTAKRPERCPHCGGSNLSRKGTRRKKLEIVQVWRCFACKRTFTPGPAALRNRTYPLRMVLAALTDYDTGLTLEETAARLRKKTRRTVSPSTVASWLEQYKRHCSYRRLRAKGVARFPANQTIRTIKLYHRQIYSFAYHRPKLDFLRAGALDDKRKGDKRFAPLADFLEHVPTDCPHQLFSGEGETKARASQAVPTFADTAHAIVNIRENAATETAALIIPAVGNNTADPRAATSPACSTERSRMEHIATAISVAALIVAFVAVALNKRSSELPKEKKTRKKRQPKVTREVSRLGRPQLAAFFIRREIAVDGTSAAECYGSSEAALS